MSDNLITPYSQHFDISYPHCNPNILSGVQVCKINMAGYLLNNFWNFDLNGYPVLYRLEESWDELNYVPATSKIVLNIGEQHKINSNLQNLIPNVAKDIAISEDDAVKTFVDFFSDKQVIVQSTEIQKSVYNLIGNSQQYLAMLNVKHW